MANSCLVDNANPAIEYSGGWLTGSGVPGANGTTRGPLTAGATANFTFNGTSVALFGTVWKVPDSQSACQGTSSTVNCTAPAGGTEHSLLFFRSPVLEGGEHTIIITSFDSDSYLGIDHILYTPSTGSGTCSANATTTASPTSTATSSTIKGDNATTIIIQAFMISITSANEPTHVKHDSSASPSVSPTASPLSSSGPRQPPVWAIIVGAVAGSIILLIGCSCLIWRCRRRRTSSEGYQSHTSASGRSHKRPSARQIRVPQLTPFTLTQPIVSPESLEMATLSTVPSKLPTPDNPYYAAGFRHIDVTSGTHSPYRSVHSIHSLPAVGHVDGQGQSAQSQLASRPRTVPFPLGPREPYRHGHLQAVGTANALPRTIPRTGDRRRARTEPPPKTKSQAGHLTPSGH